jgi:hypothetical protein
MNAHLDSAATIIVVEPDALAEWLDRHHPNVPLLLTSASPAKTDALSTSQKHRFIAKPYELGEVSAQIESMIPRR